MSEELFIIRSQNDKPSLPMVAFSLNPAKNLKFNEIIIVQRLKECGWIVPAYTLAANASDITVCRIVVRETFTRNMASILLEDIRLVMIRLADEHGHQDLLVSLKAAVDGQYQHRRSKQHGEKVAKDIQSKKAVNEHHIDAEKIDKNNKEKKKKHHTVHTVC
jgi:glutamate/tyrosine decarboxylase-like PLP-dependent enzyme